MIRAFIVLLAMLLAAPARAGVSITDLSGACNTSGATVTLSITAPSGSAIVVAVAEAQSGTAGSLSDATNGAYTLVQYVTDATNNEVAIFYFLNSASLAVVTLTYTKGISGRNACIAALSATGILTSSALDTAVTVSQLTASGNPPVINLTSGTPAQSGELFVAASAGQTATQNVTYTQDTGHNWATPPVKQQSATGTNTATWLAGGSQINSGSGTIIFNPTVSGFNSSRKAETLIVGFKPIASQNVFGLPVGPFGY